jgi:D-threonine aldolase
VRTTDLVTPALILDEAAFVHNLATMASELPGARMRPHVKAHKSIDIARHQHAVGHTGFTCATIREVEGLANAELGGDLLLANEVADATRLGVCVAAGARVTLAVDSEETIRAAAAGGVEEVVIDVNIGLPRCGCAPEEAGRLADLARTLGLSVGGVMGYEGHLMMVLDPVRHLAKVTETADRLRVAHSLVGGELISGGGTGTFRVQQEIGLLTEVQAGSYALMDSQYAQHEFPFQQAIFLLATVISVNRSGGWAVADCGLKANGMDHGNPSLPGADVLFLSDEHITFRPSPEGPLRSVRVGDQVRVVPAHCDPTVAYHEQYWVTHGDEVIDRWPVDLRGW